MGKCKPRWRFSSLSWVDSASTDMRNGRKLSVEGGLQSLCLRGWKLPLQRRVNIFMINEPALIRHIPERKTWVTIPVGTSWGKWQIGCAQWRRNGEVLPRWRGSRARLKNITPPAQGSETNRSKGLHESHTTKTSRVFGTAERGQSISSSVTQLSELAGVQRSVAERKEFVDTTSYSRITELNYPLRSFQWSANRNGL